MLPVVTSHSSEFGTFLHQMMGNRKTHFIYFISIFPFHCQEGVFLHCFKQAAIPSSASSFKSSLLSPSQPVIIVHLCAQVMSLMMCEWRVLSLLFLLAHGRAEALIAADRILSLEVREL